MGKQHLCLLIASLMLQGCAVSRDPPPPSIKPLLDSELEATCKPIGRPKNESDFDSWQAWVEEVVLPNYMDCAVRHYRTVKAWPK